MVQIYEKNWKGSPKVRQNMLFFIILAHYRPYNAPKHTFFERFGAVKYIISIAFQRSQDGQD